MGREGFILPIHQNWMLKHGELRALPKVTQLVNDRIATKSKASRMPVPEASRSSGDSYSSSLTGLPGVSYSFLGRLHLLPSWDHPNPSVHIHTFILSSQQTRIFYCAFYRRGATQHGSHVTKYSSRSDTLHSLSHVLRTSSSLSCSTVDLKYLLVPGPEASF